MANPINSLTLVNYNASVILTGKFPIEFNQPVLLVIYGRQVCPLALLKIAHEQWAVVVAQLVERLLPIPEVRGSNPVIGKNLSEQNGVSERSKLTPF